MDILGLLQQPPRARTDARSYGDHEFLTHDQRTGDACELEFDDLDTRERTIFLRCGFRAPRTT